MAKQLHVGQNHRLEGVGVWRTDKPECVTLWECFEDTDGKVVPNGVEVTADCCTPEGEPAIITLDGATVLRVNVVPADCPREPECQDLAPAS